MKVGKYYKEPKKEDLPNWVLNWMPNYKKDYVPQYSFSNGEDFINEFLEKNINEYGCAKEFIDELVYNTNGLVPCPGTYQYGNCVRILNKEDFN